MTQRDFRARFRSLDPELLRQQWRAFLDARGDWDERARIVELLDRLEADARLSTYQARPHALA